MTNPDFTVQREKNPWDHWEDWRTFDTREAAERYMKFRQWFSGHGYWATHWRVKP